MSTRLALSRCALILCLLKFNYYYVDKIALDTVYKTVRIPHLAPQITTMYTFELYNHKNQKAYVV